MITDGTTRPTARLAAGASAELYPWREQQVVKLFKRGFPREAIELELHHSRVAHLAGVPTPRPEGLVTLEGRTGIVLERCDGPTLYELIAARARPPAELARVFFELQQAIHRCTAPALEPITARLARRLPQARGIPDEARRAAAAMLREAPERNELCHGDFHPINVIVGTERTVAIDWLDAARGDPAIDVTRTLVYLRYSRPGAVDESYRAQFLEAYLEHCRAAWAGRMEELVRWQLPVAVARLAEPLEDGERRQLLELVASL
ncbi:MAG TPA: phosphotransferase [Burkholderiales bacterium]